MKTTLSIILLSCNLMWAIGRSEVPRIEEIENSDIGIDRVREWCDPVLGCLQITEEWYCPSRQINYLPDSRASINTRFYLHTRSDPSENKDLEISADEVESIEQSSFDVQKPTIFIVHGYIETGDSNWLKDLSLLLLKHGDYNVLRVDWGRRSRTLYGEAVADTRVVGLEIGHFVNTLISIWGYDPAQTHCIGHSLGSHICGYAGEKVDRMGRITGLDPAGPYFHDTPYFVRLDPSDADFVDVVHTDAGSNLLFGYGTYQQMGHLDFYVNGGENQPGCDPVSISFDFFKRSFIDELKQFVSCSHSRAVDYLMESLNGTECTWMAHECENYSLFQQGMCSTCGEDGGNCARMGMEAAIISRNLNQSAKLYLDTNPSAPFCTNPYLFSLLTALPNEAESWVIGTLYLSMYGDQGQIIRKMKISKKHERLEHGQMKMLMANSGMFMGEVLHIELEWFYDDEILDPTTYCNGLFCNRSLYVHTLAIQNMNSEQLGKWQKFCGPEGEVTKIKDTHKVSLFRRDDCTFI